MMPRSWWACDFFAVITAAALRTLYVFVVLEIGSRQILHHNVTAHPTAEWTLQQFRETPSGDHPYRLVIRDRDSIFAEEVDKGLANLGVRVLRTPTDLIFATGDPNRRPGMRVSISCEQRNRRRIALAASCFDVRAEPFWRLLQAYVMPLRRCSSILRGQTDLDQFGNQACRPAIDIVLPDYRPHTLDSGGGLFRRHLKGSMDRSRQFIGVIRIYD